MSHNWKTLSVLLIFLHATLVVNGQVSNPWTFKKNLQVANQEQSRQIVPQAYRTFSLDVPVMKQFLSKLPLWHTPAAETSFGMLTLPMPDGSFMRFKVMEAPVMHPDLQAKFPEIRSYAGVGIDDPAAYFRGDFTLRGFHGMISSPEHSTVYIDPFSTADIKYYQVYYRKDFQKATDWSCRFDEVNRETVPSPLSANAEFMAGDCQLRTYTLALACTGEYAAFHGGTVPLVASAYVTSMTRVNGVFERDLSLTMQLHPNTNSLIYLVASTDPYTNGDGGAMLTQNQTTCDNIIGNANYDIGHVFSTGGGGVAYLGCICNTSNKAGGVTGQSSPVGDPFDIDYVAHEMGHQLGANHTQNNNCNRSAAAAHEPGSASTIMGYAGICSPNVQNNSDDYFHAHSLQEIAAELTSNGTGGGNTCSTNTVVNSGPPTANAGPDFVIPKSTPFILTGTGTDPTPGDVLTYTWEQMNPTTATMPPVATSTAGPAFRSNKGTTNPSRYLPRLADVISNTTPTWEVLPSVARTLNFRLVVRDNHIGGGCTAEDNAVVTVNGTAGPFLVTSPNTAVSYTGGSSQTITWDVAGTTAAPINCANVDILMSSDGGLTYPYTLATATPNDGTQAILLPNISTTTARVMVRANGNIFYDISNTNFTITALLDGFTMSSTPTSRTVCAGSSAVYTINITAAGTFSGSINLSVPNLPVGATATFSPSVVVNSSTSTLTITTTSVATGAYTPTITGTSGANTATVTVDMLVNPNVLNQVALSAPANQLSGTALTPTLTWASLTGASAYQVQVSTSSSFSSTLVDLSGITATSYTITSGLNPGSTYYWRVRGSNSCATGAWPSEFQFSTGCQQTYANTTVVPISTTATQTITSTISLSDITGNIVSIKVKDLKIHHTYIGDIKATLTSPTNAIYTLFDRPGVPGTSFGCSNNHILATFDDAATLTAAQFESTCNASTAGVPGAYAITGTYKPVTLLADLNGSSPNGTWTLTIQDFDAGDGGSLQTWGLEVATECNSTLSLSQTFIQGYMDDATGNMRPVMQLAVAAGGTVPGYPAPTAAQCDLITVELHDATAPYAMAHTKTVVLGVTGAATVNFPVSVSGNSYYLVIKGRNLLETWSKNPVAFTATTSYNFGAATQAYGNNLGMVGAVLVIYNGDINLDSNLDPTDQAIWEAAANNFSTGYIQSDLNGDGNVDPSDQALWQANANAFLSVFKP
jgi:subtilisin-like proprotein convertase family protein